MGLPVFLQHLLNFSGLLVADTAGPEKGGQETGQRAVEGALQDLLPVRLLHSGPVHQGGDHGGLVLQAALVAQRLMTV